METILKKNKITSLSEEEIYELLGKQLNLNNEKNYEVEKIFVNGKFESINIYEVSPNYVAEGI